jgi:hypothetical protein
VTDRGLEAAHRAGAALARARELSARLDELRAGHPVEAFDSERAAQLARRAVENASEALRQASAAHHSAADVHRQLADLLESLGHQERAAQHRAYADLDDAAGDADEVGLVSEVPPADRPPAVAPPEAGAGHPAAEP